MCKNKTISKLEANLLNLVLNWSIYFVLAFKKPSRNLLSLYQELGPNKHFHLVVGATSFKIIKLPCMIFDVYMLSLHRHIRFTYIPMDSLLGPFGQVLRKLCMFTNDSHSQKLV